MGSSCMFVSFYILFHLKRRVSKNVGLYTETDIIPIAFTILYLLDDESPTSANLGNDHGFINRVDHGFINKEYYLHWCEAFWRSPKQNHESLCSKWTISYYCGESCSSNRIHIQCLMLCDLHSFFWS